MDKKVDILSELKALSTDYKKVYLPSVQKEVDIKPLTLKQQKDVIKLAADNVTSIISFNVALFYIFKENVHGADVDNLNVLDRSCLALAFRHYFINENTKVVRETEEGEAIKEVKISTILENFNKVDAQLAPEVITEKNFKFHVSIPKLGIDKDFNKAIKSKYKDIKTKEEIKELFGDMYSHEIGKFITKIVIDKEEDIEYDFTGISIPKRVEILEAIPTEIYSKITDYTKKVREIENQLLTVDVDGLKYTAEITGELFTP